MNLRKARLLRDTRQVAAKSSSVSPGKAHDDVGRQRRLVERARASSGSDRRTAGCPSGGASAAARHRSRFASKCANAGRFACGCAAITAISSRVTSVASMLLSRMRNSPGRRARRSQQVRQPQPIGLGPLAAPFDAVMAQVDAGQHDFAIAVVDQPPHFVENVLGRPAGQVRPHAWE